MMVRRSWKSITDVVSDLSVSAYRCGDADAFAAYEEALRDLNRVTGSRRVYSVARDILTENMRLLRWLGEFASADALEYALAYHEELVMVRSPVPFKVT